MKKTISIIIATSFILISCATPEERRRGTPDLQISTRKSSKDIAICIADRWENTKPFMMFSSPPVNTAMRANGYTVTATDRNGYGSTSTIVLADVIERNNETVIQFYKQAGGGFGKYEDEVKNCQ